MSLRFYLDEDCQAVALASALREHSIDVLTTNEAGLSGVDDESQLPQAAGEQRVLVTNNICDFVPLHTRWLAEGRPAHAGIVLCGQQTLSIGETVRRLLNLSRTRSGDRPPRWRPAGPSSALALHSIRAGTDGVFTPYPRSGS